MFKKHAPILINVAVAAATAYLVSKKEDSNVVTWYNPATWF